MRRACSCYIVTTYMCTMLFASLNLFLSTLDRVSRWPHPALNSLNRSLTPDRLSTWPGSWVEGSWVGGGVTAVLELPSGSVRLTDLVGLSVRRCFALGAQSCSLTRTLRRLTALDDESRIILATPRAISVAGNTALIVSVRVISSAEIIVQERTSSSISATTLQHRVAALELR